MEGDDTSLLVSDPVEIVVADGCGTACETVLAPEDGDDAPPVMTVLTGRAKDDSPVSTVALPGCVVGTDSSLDPIEIPVGSPIAISEGLEAEDGPVPATPVVTGAGSSIPLLT